MTIAPTPKPTFAYVDSANLHRSTVNHGWYVDYERFYVWLVDKYSIEKAYMFIGYLSKYENLYSKMKKAGFTLIFKEIVIGSNGQVKGNCDSDLVLYAVRDFYEYNPKQVVFISSDGDFASTITFLKDKGVSITIISPSDNCSILLRRINIPLLYLNTQRNNIQLEAYEVEPLKEKALDGDGTP